MMDTPVLSAGDDIDQYSPLIDSEEVEIHSDNGNHHGRWLCGKISPSSYVYLASAVAAIGGLLFGYDTGIISGALLQLTDEFMLTCFQQELVVSSMLIGAVVASLFGGFLIDKYGRRPSIIVNSVVYLLGALILAGASNLAVLVVGRLIVGFAVSFSATSECIYISEISPARKRGRLVSFNEFFITIGFLLAYLINYSFIEVQNGWRWMFVLSAIPALIQGVLMIFLPPSPRFLVMKNKISQARETLLLIRQASVVDAELESIQESADEQKASNVCDLFKPLDNMPLRMLMGVGLVAFQQFTGQPSVLYYAPIIFKSVGFTADSAATLATVGIGVIKVLSTAISLLIIDKFGRRKFLTTGTAIMTVSIATIGLAMINMETKSDPCTTFYLNISDSEQKYAGNEIPIVTTIVPLTQTEDLINNAPTAQKYLALFGLMFYVTGYSFSFGPVTWLILSEIFPAKIKGRAVSLITVVNWSANLLVSLTFLTTLGALGSARTFLLYSFVCLTSVIFVVLFIPETKGKTLEQIATTLQQRRLCSWDKYCPFLKYVNTVPVPVMCDANSPEIIEEEIFNQNPCSNYHQQSNDVLQQMTV